MEWNRMQQAPNLYEKAQLEFRVKAKSDRLESDAISTAIGASMKKKGNRRFLLAFIIVANAMLFFHSSFKLAMIMHAQKKKSMQIMKMKKSEFMASEQLVPVNVRKITAKKEHIETNTTQIMPLQSLPNFHTGDGGGVVIFYHVAKTGGSTIRNLFRKQIKRKKSYFLYRRLKNNADRKQKAADVDDSNFGKDDDVDVGDDNVGDDDEDIPESASCVDGTLNWLRSIDKKVMKRLKSVPHSTKHLLLEVHGANLGMKGFAPFIQKWRKTSQVHGKPFFAFTIVRDPLPFAISYFKMYHHDCPHDWCEHDQFKDATVDNFVRSIIPNRQCFLLSHRSAVEGMDSSFYSKCKVTEKGCDDLYIQTMKENLDWIGRTEELSSETIPLLSYILSGDSSGGKLKKPNNLKIAPSLAFEDALDEATTSKIISLSKYDQVIYDKVKEEYKLSNFFGN
uniref:Sulfotransferase domain-containing protein n=1 Tax=Chaetoceros debilis TaxID=122233 RepID=A0A7S3PUK3_9STRA|mmetsp:Transcript_26920/g.39850  ORF Transcript_26920/g.39850 Transcript_26920/m.39850 type:complete len:450 (+) Transcript_26920:88-1437(+)